MADGDGAEKVDALLDTPNLAEALESDQFKQFLDHVPVAIAVSEIQPSETITYANCEFERLTGRSAADITGSSWRMLPGIATAADDDRALRDAVREDAEYIGEFTIEREGESVNVAAWSNTIEDETGKPMFRLVALAKLEWHADAKAKARQESDVLLRELQHRVKNNLQMITALIRIEARNAPDDASGDRFKKLAGRVSALSVLYDALVRDDSNDRVDLGAYLGQIASAVMQAHGVEGIRLDMKLDAWPVSVDVAMPAGLVVNELMTNSLKYAFVGREGGSIRLHSLIDETGCHIVIADDGVGLPEGEAWPKPGKLSAVIAQTLRQNASAKLEVKSVPGEGMSVVISFAKP
jgi:PAS domain S-box-containing protein